MTKPLFTISYDGTPPHGLGAAYDQEALGAFLEEEGSAFAHRRKDMLVAFLRHQADELATSRWVPQTAAERGISVPASRQTPASGISARTFDRLSGLDQLGGPVTEELNVAGIRQGHEAEDLRFTESEKVSIAAAAKLHADDKAGKTAWSPPAPTGTIDALIARSSFGEPEVVAAHEQSDPALVAKVLDRVKELEQQDRWPKLPERERQDRMTEPFKNELLGTPVPIICTFTCGHPMPLEGDWCVPCGRSQRPSRATEIDRARWEKSGMDKAIADELKEQLARPGKTDPITKFESEVRDGFAKVAKELREEDDRYEAKTPCKCGRFVGLTEKHQCGFFDVVGPQPKTELKLHNQDIRPGLQFDMNYCSTCYPHPHDISRHVNSMQPTSIANGGHVMVEGDAIAYQPGSWGDPKPLRCVICHQEQCEHLGTAGTSLKLGEELLQGTAVAPVAEVTPKDWRLDPTNRIGVPRPFTGTIPTSFENLAIVLEAAAKGYERDETTVHLSAGLRRAVDMVKHAPAPAPSPYSEEQLEREVIVQDLQARIEHEQQRDGAAAQAGLVRGLHLAIKMIEARSTKHGYPPTEAKP
jgi:hypothetical protein